MKRWMALALCLCLLAGLWGCKKAASPVDGETATTTATTESDPPSTAATTEESAVTEAEESTTANEVASTTADETANTTEKPVLVTQPTQNTTTAAAIEEETRTTEDISTLPANLRPFLFYSNMDDFCETVKTMDVMNYWGTFTNTLEPIRKDGFVWVPYYQGKPAMGAEHTDTVVTLQSQHPHEGHGYSYVNINEIGAFPIHFYYLDEDEGEIAKRELYRAPSGKGDNWSSTINSMEEALAAGYQPIQLTIDGQSRDAMHYRHSETHQMVWFLLENRYIVKITNSNDADLLEYVKGLTFEKRML